MKAAALLLFCLACQAFSSSYVTKWLPPSERQHQMPEIKLTDQQSHIAKMGHGKPVAMSFVYTRCQNARKCPLVASRMGKLQKALRDVPAQLWLITYDPEYDSAPVFTKFAKSHGLRPSADALLLRPDPAEKESLFKQLNVAVNFNGDAVNLHGIQLLLFDKQGRYVRTHHTLIWDNADVLADLKRLASE